MNCPRPLHIASIISYRTKIHFSGQLLLALFSSLMISTMARAAGSRSGSRVTYDVTGSQSTVEGRNIQELNLGLNWFLQDWLIWRNSAFQRQGQDIESTYGLDSSLRLQTEISNKEKTLGFRFFVGPGVRLTNTRASASFAEAGIGLRLGGLLFSVGGRSMHYFTTQQDKIGQTLPRDQTQVFVTISGGGAFSL
jgi:hypothetical protein